MTNRTSARVAGLAILAAEAMATTFQVERSKDRVVLAVLLVLQLAALMWSTSRRATEALKAVVPAVLAGVTAAAGWTAVVFAVPRVAMGDALALVAIVFAGILVAVWPPFRTGRRLRPQVMIASASCAVLIFLTISAVLPAIPGFVSNWHPPTYTDVTRLVDPVAELAVFALLTVALAVDGLWVWRRTRRGAGNRAIAAYGTEPNEMVVVTTGPV